MSQLWRLETHSINAKMPVLIARNGSCFLVFWGERTDTDGDSSLVTDLNCIHTKLNFLDVEYALILALSSVLSSAHLKVNQAVYTPYI